MCGADVREALQRGRAAGESDTVRSEASERSDRYTHIHCLARQQDIV